MKNDKTERPVISFWGRLLDLLSPRQCVVCGQRLTMTEETLCASCNLRLPRTGFQYDPYENDMAKMFWHLMPVERAASFFYYEAHSEVSHILFQLKYGDHPEIGVTLGRMMAREFLPSGFFEGIDKMIPVPLSKKRLRRRGYNQSLQLADGIREATGIPVDTESVMRTTFKDSQTHLSRWGRLENVEGTFTMRDHAALEGRHILLIDDVATTGATVLACAKALTGAADIRLSVLTLGFAKS